MLVNMGTNIILAQGAQEDCEKALELEPSNIKALYRKALANKVRF